MIASFSGVSSAIREDTIPAILLSWVLASSESTVITFTIASQVADGILAGLEENLLATTLIFLQFWL
ncbi:hypothetical protein ABTE17_21540, partial [Acinetobacter baumannii]